MKTKVRQREKKLWRAVIFFILHFSFFIFLSCSSDDDIAPPGLPEGRSGISFEIGFAGQGGLKAATDADFKTTWETGDEIGLFAVKAGESLLASGNSIHNMKVTYDGANWNGAYWPNDENKTENLDFYAYYPYDAGVTNPLTYTFTVKADQSGQTNSKSNYNLSDLLLAKVTNQSKGSTVNLTFSHALSLLQVEVKKEVNVPHLDGDLTVTLTGALPDATLSWSGDLTGTGTLTDIVMHKVADLPYTYRALVPAQTLSADSKVTFKQTTTGKEIDMEYQGVKSASLTAKNAHKYSVTLGWGIDENHEYAVGDVYPHTGPAIGIVFYITDNGKHGKVVGLKENPLARWDDGNYNTGARDQANGLINMQKIAEFIENNTGKSWTNFPHFSWVHSMNDANEDYSKVNAKGVWYLPALNELGNYNPNSLYIAYASDMAGFNQKLTSAGGKVLGIYLYFSSSETNDGTAWIVNSNGGGTFDILKDFICSARCVLAF